MARISYYSKLSGKRTRNNNPPSTCTVDGCDRPHLAKGFCRKHYAAYKKHGVEEMLIDHHSYNSKGLVQRKDRREYRSWCEMKRRCDDPRRKAYSRYGGAGIKYCDRWSVFENFFEDMGECPEGMSLDRIDNTKGYYPENCRWADARTQSRNRSNNIKFGGVMLIDLLAERGIKVSTFYNRAKAKGVTPLELWKEEYV